MVTGGFPSQRASNTPIVSIWWCHHVAGNKCRCLRLGLGLGLGGIGREVGDHRARVSASVDSRLLNIGSELASASSVGRWSILVWSCLRMSVSFPRSSLTVHGISRCDALVLESARCSPSKSDVTATSPCTILNTRARRWDFRCCSKVCQVPG